MRATATVDLGAGPVDYELRRGRDPGRAPLVFLHEGLGSLGLWRGWPAEVARRSGRDTLVWSRHGYGASGGGWDPFPVGYLHDQALRVLPELLDRLGVVAPVLVGHSDGASIALIHAGRASSPVSGVVAMAPHVIVEDRTIAGIEAARHAYRTTDLPARLARHHLDADATFWRWNDIWLAPAFRTWTIEDCLPGVTAPVLALQCTGDEYGTADQLRRIAAGTGGPVACHLVDGSSHSPHLEAPVAVTELVTAWLADRP